MDIVERLRELLILDGDGIYNPIAGDAADEIERLRGKLEQGPVVYCFTEEASNAVLKLNAKDREIERLRQQVDMLVEALKNLHSASNNAWLVSYYALKKATEVSDDAG